MSSVFFPPPADGVYRTGDEIQWFARFHKDVAVSGAPVLVQRIGEAAREARHRPDIETPQLAGAVFFTYTVQSGACDADGVGIPADAIRGGRITEADGRHAADRSHGAQDPRTTSGTAEPGRWPAPPFRRSRLRRSRSWRSSSRR